jgi:hypothetical protein
MLVATYKTKKELKSRIGQRLLHIETSMFGQEFERDGSFPVVGPGAYQRVWYAKVTMKEGLISKVI